MQTADPRRAIPIDLVAVIALSLLAIGAVVTDVGPVAFRTVLAAAFVFVAPGYAFVAAIFPGQPPPDDSADPVDYRSEESNVRVSIDGTDRAVLSVAASVALVPLLLLVTSMTPLQLRPTTAVGATAATTVGLAVLASARRRRLPDERRFRVPVGAWRGSLAAAFSTSRPRYRLTANVLVVASLLIAAGSVGYMAATPRPGEQFTELYLLTRDDGGNLTADGYPTSFETGETEHVIVGIENRERRTVSYSLVVALHRIGPEGSVTERSRLAHRDVDQLHHGETGRVSVGVTPEITGERLRLTFLLYRGDPPDPATVDAAYRHVHLRIGVE